MGAPVVKSLPYLLNRCLSQHTFTESFTCRYPGSSPPNISVYVVIMYCCITSDSQIKKTKIKKQIFVGQESACSLAGSSASGSVLGWHYSWLLVGASAPLHVGSFMGLLMTHQLAFPKVSDERERETEVG